MSRAMPFVRTLAAGALLALLGGCAAGGILARDEPKAADIPRTSPALPPPPPSAAANVPAGKAPPAPAPARAWRLLARDAAELVTLIGPPDLVRREDTVQIFQYRGGDDCILELVLYERDGRFFVRYVTARRRHDGEPMHPDRCLTRLLPAARREALADPLSTARVPAATPTGTPTGSRKAENPPSS